MDTAFSAIGPSLGYLYQVRYALFLLLDHSEEAELSVEGLDDVTFEEAGNPTELLQLKHHLSSTASLTDYSADLWKSLRVWSTGLVNKAFTLPGVLLTLISTGTAPDSSVAALLRPGKGRDHTLAAAKLAEIAATSKNQVLGEAFSAFLSLPQGQRELLTAAILVLDSSPNIIDVVLYIKQKLEFSVQKQYREQLYERLEGWWFARVVSHLSGTCSGTISRFEIQNVVIDIAQRFREDDLPIDFLDGEPPNPPDPERDDRLFVVQLRSIALVNRRIEKAIRDYYRAYEQRSRWARNELLIDEELEKYEKKLVDEWERYFLAQQQSLPNDSSAEEELQACGRQVYDWMEFTADFPIRPRVTENYVMRGSYHILADRLATNGGQRRPYVWWHPRFLERLKALLPAPR